MHYQSEQATIYNGDCLAVMSTFADNSVDAIVTDPPYGLSFMGKGWDHGVPGVHFWEAAIRILKPGGHLLAFGGTRTHHRLVCAIEDAGFEIRDEIQWIYGSGFPKSLDVSKAIDKSAGAERKVVGEGTTTGARKGSVIDDGKGYTPGRSFQNAEPVVNMITAPATDAAKQWSGWGTALKPAQEPICVARKPLIGTVAHNVMTHGTGGINVDGCRVATNENLNGGAYAAEGSRQVSGSLSASGMNVPGKTVGAAFVQPEGRWPANLIHDGSDEVLAGFPDTGKSTGGRTANISKTSEIYGGGKGLGQDIDPESVRGDPGFGDSGSAARFFYSAKANKKERRDSKHPTVKPVSLMRYLVRLVTPPNGLVLDPFMGSGSTIEAAKLEGFRAIGIDLSEEYCTDAVRRLDAVT